MKQFFHLTLLLVIGHHCLAQNMGLSPSNPFASPSRLPFQAPPFDKIRNTDYSPAFRAGIDQKLKEIKAIADNPAAPTFENTVVALERTGQLLNRVNDVFSAITNANTNDTLQKLQEEIAPDLASLESEMYLNPSLFARLRTIYANRAGLHLDTESNRLLDHYYQAFVMGGADLSDVDKDTLKRINKEEALLSAKFQNQLLKAANEGALVISEKTQLEGLSETDLAAFAQNAKVKGLSGKWLIPLKNTTQQPSFKSLSDRGTRQSLFQSSWMRAEKNDSNDTRDLIVRLAFIRAKKAKLLGFANYAAWRLQDQMAQTPEAVDKFLSGLSPLAVARAKREASDIQAEIDRQKGGFSLQPWDWDYYAEQVRKIKYDLDENEVKPYFELDRVLEKGVFYAANQLYGLTFKERHDIPVYHQGIRVFEVFDKDGRSLALFYGDYYKRDNKSGGAWMNNFVTQSTLLGTKPVIYNVCNFANPTPGQPALLSYDDVKTMFHEFGHGLHGIFATQRYPTLSGTNTPNDFVEFPSQFNEHWALEPMILKNYALHYKTGKPIPQVLIDKIMKARTFNAGYDLTELISAASLDLQWHKLSPGEPIKDVDKFEKDALQATGFDFEPVPPRYRSSYFLHIWSNGYAASYYAYQWTKMLEEDAYSWFEEHGGMTKANGQRFRDMILSRGNSEDLNKLYRAFRGRDANIDAMKKYLGLDQGK